MYGTRISLTIGLIGVTMSLFLGVVLAGSRASTAASRIP